MDRKLGPCRFLDFKHRKQLVEACLISHLRYAIELHSQGTVAQIRKAEGMLKGNDRIKKRLENCAQGYRVRKAFVVIVCGICRSG